ncbi:hypothetical protein VIBNISFn118_1030042 [Vibrio nigripulchritudo SFn118]|nr:hypothetical protein VIBNISFn118_1030042 [Vibrio nigripulchritudo SFn118]
MVKSFPLNTLNKIVNTSQMYMELETFGDAYRVLFILKPFSGVEMVPLVTQPLCCHLTTLAHPL